MRGRAWSYGAVRGPSVLHPPRSMPLSFPDPTVRPLCVHKEVLYDVARPYAAFHPHVCVISGRR